MKNKIKTTKTKSQTRNRTFTFVRFIATVIAICQIAALSATSVAYDDDDYDYDDVTESPYFHVESENTSVDSFPLKSTNVDVTINGVIASIVVTQTYENNGTVPINASYVFPASTKVSVHGMTIEVGEDIIVAEIKEREQARAEFKQAREEGFTASLLEQERPNVFSMSVANILPGDVVNIELHYTELITSTDNVFEFVFPTVVGPRYSSNSATSNSRTSNDNWVSTPYLSEGVSPPNAEYNINVNLLSGTPVSDVSCESHETVVTYRDDNLSANLALADSEDFAGNRDFIMKYKLSDNDIVCGLILQEGQDDEDNHFVLTVQPPERPIVEKVPPREYIFVFDVSGSMSGFPLDTSKALMRDFLENLREEDYFNVVMFDSRVIRWQNKSVAAKENFINYALDKVDKEFGGGGTELLRAVKSAIDIPMREEVTSRSIVLITDGYFSGEESVFSEIEKNLDNTNYFAFGIGQGTNRHIIEGVAKAGKGEAFIVTKPSEIPETAALFRSYITSPVLSDVNVSFDGFNAYNVEPTHVSILFANSPIVVAGKWEGEPSGTITITGKNGNKDFVHKVLVSETQTTQDVDAVKYLWARKRVDRLTDVVNSSYIPFPAREEARIEITEIGLKYSMLTEYTSFVAVLKKVRANGAGVGIDVSQPLPLPSGVSNNAVGGGSPRAGVDLVGSFAVLLVFALIIFICIRKRYESVGHL